MRVSLEVPCFLTGDAYDSQVLKHCGPQICVRAREWQYFTTKQIYNKRFITYSPALSCIMNLKNTKILARSLNSPVSACSSEQLVPMNYGQCDSSRQERMNLPATQYYSASVATKCECYCSICPNEKYPGSRFCFECATEHQDN